MSEFQFRPDTKIYKNRDVLSEEYTPEELVGRDEELEEYHTALQPVINGESPSNIFLYGKSGVGKTAATKYLLNQLEEDAARIDDLSVTSITINCDGVSTSYQAAVEIVNQFRTPEDALSKTGYPRSEVYSKMWAELEQRGGTVLIVLDEVDHLNDDSILYQISRAKANSKIDSVKLGLIGISNDLGYRETLSSKVRSSLCEKEVFFPAYDASELKMVLEQRKNLAFQDDAVGDGVIGLCAAYGARESGDARQALDLLLGAGDIARSRSVDRVSEDIVKVARQKLETDNIQEGVRGLSPQGTYMLFALVIAEENGNAPIRLSKMRSTYEQICEQEGSDPVSNRALRDRLAELNELGIISSEQVNRGREGGSYKRHELEYEPNKIRGAIDMA